MERFYKWTSSQVFFKDFDCRFHLETFTAAIFEDTFSPQNTSIGCFRQKQALGAVLEKKAFWDVFLSDKLRCSGCSVERAAIQAKLWICFLHQNTWKKNLFLSLLNWPEKKRFTKEHGPVAAFVYYIKGYISWYGKSMNKIKICITFYTTLISPLRSPFTIFQMKPRTQSGNT